MVEFILFIFSDLDHLQYQEILLISYEDLFMISFDDLHSLDLNDRNCLIELLLMFFICLYHLRFSLFFHLKRIKQKIKPNPLLLKLRKIMMNFYNLLIQMMNFRLFDLK